MEYIPIELIASAWHLWVNFKYILLSYIVPYILTYFVHSALVAGTLLVPLGILALVGYTRLASALHNYIYAGIVPFALGLALVTTITYGPIERYDSELVLNKKDYIEIVEAKKHILKLERENNGKQNQER